ncbi:MAG TPA: hypothetical protein VK999_04400 [Methylotenera sp.]|nr:hypothetical protein [Methylotenera sp.]
MKIMNKKRLFPQAALYLLLVCFTHTANAENLLGYLIDSDGRYVGPSVEDNVRVMDTDKNGFADVYEVRAFLELKHGKGYEKELLDKLESAARGSSCSTPFAKALYSD